LAFVTHSFESYTVEVLKGVMEALSGTGLDLIVYANSDTYGSRSDGWE
jgi:LacI family transcriptional regulator